MNIFIINHCSTNKGDKAVLEFLLQELAASGVKNITVSANEPMCCLGVKPPSHLQVKYVPWGWNVARNRNTFFISRLIEKIRHKYYRLSYAMVRRHLLNDSRIDLLNIYCNSEFFKALISADIVISTGGHHVTSILAPNAISPQTFEMALALLAGKPLFLWSQSIGPFKFFDERNRLFIKKILLRSSAIYVRDERSLNELEKLEIASNNIRKTFESVLGFGGMIHNIDKPSVRSPVVGISIYSIKARSIIEHEMYVDSFRKVIDYITAAGYMVKFFPMQLQNEQADDRPCIEAILNSVQKPEQCSVYNDATSMLDHIKEVSKCCLFIGHKTHSVIFALVTGTPLLAIAYHPKTEDFMAQFELSANCIDDRFLEGNNIINMFDRIISQMDAISAIQLQKSAFLGKIVRRDFSEMLRH